MTDDIPRRCQLDKMTLTERAIYGAMQTVEAAGCDVRLTEAVNLLQKARDKVADFVDGVNAPKAEWHANQGNLDPNHPDEEKVWSDLHNALEASKALKEALARIKSLEDGIVAENRRTSAVEAELQTALAHVKTLENQLAVERGLTNTAIEGSSELGTIRCMLAATAADPDAELERLRAPDETAAEVSALLSHDRVASEERDQADERASTATDILCGALGHDHGRGGLVEHCQKAADKVKELERDFATLAALNKSNADEGP